MRSERMRVVSEIYRISKMGMEAAEIILPKVHEEELKSRIAGERESYRNFAEKSAEILRKNGAEPGTRRRIRERLLRGYVDFGTLVNKSPQHISGLMISGKVMGMMDITKMMNRSAESFENIRLAEEYLDAEQRDVDLLGKYL